MLYDLGFLFEPRSWLIQSTKYCYHHYTILFLKALSHFPLRKIYINSLNKMDLQYFSLTLHSQWINTI